MVSCISTVCHHFSQHTEVKKTVLHFMTQNDLGESPAFTPSTVV